MVYWNCISSRLHRPRNHRLQRNLNRQFRSRCHPRHGAAPCARFEQPASATYVITAEVRSTSPKSQHWRRQPRPWRERRRNLLPVQQQDGAAASATSAATASGISIPTWRGRSIKRTPRPYWNKTRRAQWIQSHREPRRRQQHWSAEFAKLSSPVSQTCRAISRSWSTSWISGHHLQMALASLVQPRRVWVWNCILARFAAWSAPSRGCSRTISLGRSTWNRRICSCPARSANCSATARKCSLTIVMGRSTRRSSRKCFRQSSMRRNEMRLILIKDAGVLTFEQRTFKLSTALYDYFRLLILDFGTYCCCFFSIASIY